jgi:PAS domain S-box-containing protein
MESLETSKLRAMAEKIASLERELAETKVALKMEAEWRNGSASIEKFAPTEIGDVDSSPHAAAELFNTSVENLMDGFALLSAVRGPGKDGNPGKIVDFRYEYINEAGCRLNLRSRKEHIGRTMLELLPAHNETGFFSEYVNLVETGQPMVKESIDYSDTFGDGVWLERTFEMRAFKVGDGFALTWRDITSRKEMEKHLAYQAMLLDNVHDAIIATDEKLRVTSWNNAAQRLYGWTEAEAMGQNVTELLRMQITQEECSLLLNMLSEKGIASEEVVQYTRDGRQVILEATGLALRDGDGNVNGYVASVRDITEAKKREQALRRSEERFRSLADAMPQLVWTANPDGSVDYYNQRYLGFEGISVTENGLWQWSPVVHPDDLQATQEAWQRAVETGEPYEIEHRVAVTDDGFHWFLSRAIAEKDDQGRVIKWYGTATDIHDLKHAEENLRDHSNRLALLSEAAAALLRGEDPHKLLDWVYKRAANLLDLDIYTYYKLSEDGQQLDLIGHSGEIEDIFSQIQVLKLGQGICGMSALTQQVILAEDIQNSAERMTRFVRSMGMSTYACFPLVIKERLIGTLSFGARKPVFFDQAAVDLMRALADLFANAIDRTAGENALKEYAVKLERSNRELQDFAFIASHDLREPLRKVVAFGQALQKPDNNLDEQQRDYIDRMNSAANRMQAMIDELLKLSRVATQTRPFVPVDLNQTMEHVISDLEIQIETNQAEVVVDDLPTVEADPLQMGQLFLNLVGNALKFHRPEESPRVRVYSGRMTGKEVEIMVEDNGTGFDDQYVERIFLPFQRLVGRSEVEGSGMGLAICRKIVDRHGGKITARSIPGKGSTFTVMLPR